jgi:hypothetical protein
MSAVPSLNNRTHNSKYFHSYRDVASAELVGTTVEIPVVTIEN